jgi:uncharacterized protein YndB with AHSA1/START domain
VGVVDDEPMSGTESTPTEHLDAVTRRVGTVTRDGEELRNLTVRRTLPVDAPELWRAVTEAERVPQWFLPVTGDLEVGGRYRLEGNARGEVLECVPHERFAVTWVFEGHPSRVDVSLRPVADGTLLQLDHAIPVDDDRLAELGPGTVGIGWELALVALADHLTDTTGVAGPAGSATAQPEERQRFHREVVDGSGREWAAAAIADGEDPERARAAAQRCVAAYEA